MTKNQQLNNLIKRGNSFIEVESSAESINDWFGDAITYLNQDVSPAELLRLLWQLKQSRDEGND